jgi:hypothetical protein
VSESSEDERGASVQSLPRRFTPRHRSTQVLAIAIALLALVFGLYRAAPASIRAALPGGTPVTHRHHATATTTSTSTVIVSPTTTSTLVPVDPFAATTTPTTEHRTVASPTTQTPPSTSTTDPPSDGDLALSASSNPAFDGSSIQDTVTADLSRNDTGYGGQTVTYTGPGCTSATEVTASDGSATAVLTCAQASSIPVTVSSDGKSVVTTVEE